MAEEAGGLEVDENLPPTAALRKRRPAMRLWTAMVAMLAVTGVQYPDMASGFTAYDCANATNRMDVYSLLEPAAYPTTTSHQPRMRAADDADCVGTEMEC